MEEINCPQCGKPNPIDNKFCDFCLAHLHPSDGGQAESDPQIPTWQEDNRDGLGGHEAESEVPEWLSELQESTQAESEAPDEPGSDLGQPTDALSDWMGGVTDDKDTTTGEEDPISPFLPDQDINESQDIPHWLDDALIEQEPQESIEDEILPEIYLASDKTDPSPVGSITSDFGQETPGSLDNAGPLAGLKGILSAEAGVARARNPKAYSANLKISTSQRAHIELLKTLVEEEGQPEPLPGRKSISQQHVVRWGIALVLLIAILWPIITTSQQMPFPVYDEGSAEVNRLINELPDNARVLVGFDFEPGLAAELDTAAAPVIDHLMGEGALLTLISTSPTGPILAERFMQFTLSDQEFIRGLEYVNLGYIPGGAAGLLSFIESPQRTMPYSIDGFPVWETETGSALPALEGINKIADYSMVILLVDDPDTARIWIEQLGTKITDPQLLTSFVLITSAQLEPVVRPYYESFPQPVNGLVVGLRGGAAYARLIGGDHIPGEYWDAFGMGTFVAALLLLVGSLGYYVIPELSRSDRGQDKVEQ